MKKIKLITSLSALLIVLAPAGTFALDVTPAAQDSSAATTAANQTKLNDLKTRGSAEITRRLATLDKMSAVINGSSKLSSADKTSLISQVNSEISGLTALKTKLNADTDLTTALADVQSIYSEYRVYALLVPKIYLLNTSDNELTNDDKLTTLAGKLQTRITAAQTAGKDVTSLQSSLSDMNAKISAAQGLANAVNSKVEPLQPSDYNTDKTILSGQRDQLQTAHQDNVAAYNDAKTIVAGLK